MTRYVPSRHYFYAGLVAVACGLFSGWSGLTWTPAFLAAGIFLLSAVLCLYLASRPRIEIHDTHLAIGRLHIPWADIRRLDHRGWLALLAVRITLFDHRRIVLLYPGNVDSSNSLLRHLRRGARAALIDGVPYRQFWGSAEPGVPEARSLPSPRYRILRPEDEDEVERLYQRLKAVRHLDSDSSTDEP